MRTVLYRRATFVTHLPVEHLYTPSHNWLARAGEGQFRVGYTKFALRMLGELVDVRFEAQAGAAVEPGQIIGSIEGFKAISDIYCVGRGQFEMANPQLAKDLEPLNESPYIDGWLYQFAGEADSRAMDLDGYRGLLDVTIDRILEKQKQEEQSP